MKRMTSDQSTRASLFPRGSTRRGTSADAGQFGRFREKSLVLDAAVDEYLRLQRAGTPVSKEEFCERYPDYRHSLRRLIDVEETLPGFEALEQDPWPEVGGCFLGYEILDLLGAGSIARVFLASEIKLGGRAVAIKVSKHGGYEAETLGKLRHSNIVEVYSVNHDEETDLTVVCMPYQGSATLSDVLDAAYRDQSPPRHAKIIAEVGRRMALPEAISEEQFIAADVQRTLECGTYVEGVVQLGIQLASALQYAHDHGVLHRDLKPSNVLLTPQGRPMLLDFNLSYDEALNMVHRGGTLPYSAPEQLREATQDGPASNSTVDVRADIFSLGAILYELLTGKLPYGSPPSNAGPRQAIQWQLDSQNTPPIGIRTLNRQADAQLEAIILRCLHADRDQRFASMSALESALRDHFQIQRRVKRWIAQHPIATTATASIFGLLCLAAGIFIVTAKPFHERKFLQSVIALHHQDVDGAINSLNQSLESKANHGPTHFLLGIARQKKDEHERALRAFEAARNLGYDSESLRLYWGYSLYRERRWEKMLGHYAQACDRYPESAPLHLARAYIRHVYSSDNPNAIKDDQSALHDVDEYLAKHPNRFDGYFVRAVIKFRMRRSAQDAFDDIVEDVEKACELAPSVPLLQFEAARILAAAANAKPELNGRAKARLQRAADLGWRRSSVQTCVEFLTLWGNDPWFLGIIEQCREDVKSARSVAELILKPTDAELLSLSGFVATTQASN